MSAQEFQTCMRIPKLCSLQGWKTTQLTLEDSSAQSSNWRAFARAGDSISWSRKRTLRRLRGKGKNCDFLLNLYTHVDIFTCVYSIYAYRMTFDYVCARRNEIDPKGPCHMIERPLGTILFRLILIILRAFWIIERIWRIKWFNPFNPFNPPEPFGGLKGLKGLNDLILLILLILQSFLED